MKRACHSNPVALAGGKTICRVDTAAEPIADELVGRRREKETKTPVDALKEWQRVLLRVQVPQAD